MRMNILLPETRMNSSKDFNVIWDFPFLRVSQNFPKYQLCLEMKTVFSKSR